MKSWTTAHIPNQQGRTAVVTGASGLGFEDAKALARAGAEVIMASRDHAKGDGAVARIRKEIPHARIRFEVLDLASLASVARFAGRLGSQLESLDLLINNAGVMDPQKRQVTAEGFELQFGTNHLGHFALTGHLLPLLRKGRKPRVVTVSSIAARMGAIDFADLNATRSYDTRAAYAQSKLACLMFALELQRRSEAGGWGVTSLAAHPGISRTELLFNAPGGGSSAAGFRRFAWFLFQPVPQGALPTLYAATSPVAKGGDYYGPNGFAELRGRPAVARIPTRALDKAAAAQLWEISEAMTKVRFDAFAG
jgi:NAD(P)-dependent dehydrogenase (short-subunit alcohol dehydrogenase family)